MKCSKASERSSSQPFFTPRDTIVTGSEEFESVG
jgi:hypothetical protein